MRKEGCPQKWNLLDKYLDGFYFCRLKLVEIADLLGVTHKAIEKALKKFDREAYNFERELRKSQNKIKRKENDRVRKQKEREKEPSYHLIAKRILNDQEVLHILRLAIKKLILKEKLKSDKTFNEQIMCLRYIPCFKNIFHPIPQVTSPDVELITQRNIEKIVNYEIRAMRSDLVGVPGPAILEIPGYLSSYDVQSALIYAELAIKTAGYVPTDASVTDVQDGIIKIISPTELKKLRDTYLDESISMAKVPDQPALSDLTYEQKVKRIKSWRSQARAAERDASIWNVGGGTGKKGKGGGTVNIEERQKLSAKNGY
ncbi:hypothetical protein P378_11960 [Desulforamulus profundi]|uniref:Uncharacterized protein n=1 Tax=Desulforamulus profundi TaxID=1383067 RepID=A0A2C6LHZ0_9FIRM|nr:hypothetical protein [Desulforamulus profundi]PHJ38050.1 hypothetical protein P378_11960 [Desulforamulus profundi]